MPMGIVSDKEFESELDNCSTPVPQTQKPKVEIIDSPNKGRGNNPEVPNALRQIIGEESKLNGRQSALELAQSFGVSPSSVSAYANGSTSTATYNEQPNLNHLNQSKERIGKKARHRLLLALNSISKDKLEVASVKDLAGVARDMSTISKNMEPDGPKVPVNNGPTYVMYRPEFRREDHFEVVQVKE